MVNNVGKRIYADFDRPDRKLVELFRGIPVANISDCMNRLFVMRSRIHPMGKGKNIIGTAFTVKVAPGDNLLFNKALSLAKAGDVIVVDDCGNTDRSLCGDIMYRTAEVRGFAGFVVDGAVRDVEYLEESDFPVFACAATSKGPYKNGPGEINTVISCGGQVVRPGDIIVGDVNGVLVIKPEEAEIIYESVKGKLAEEEELSEAIKDPEWVDDFIENIVKEKNFPIFDKA